MTRSTKSSPLSSPPARLSTEALDRSLGYSLRRAQLSTYDLFSASMDAFAVRPSQYAVLVLMRTNPGLSQSALCAALGIQKTNFVSLLDKLEERGLTERRKTGGDRRSSALHLTVQGVLFVAEMERAHSAMEKKLSRRLGSKRTKELLKVLWEFANARKA